MHLLQIFKSLHGFQQELPGKFSETYEEWKLFRKHLKQQAQTNPEPLPSPAARAPAEVKPMKQAGNVASQAMQAKKDEGDSQMFVAQKATKIGVKSELVKAEVCRASVF